MFLFLADMQVWVTGKDGQLGRALAQNDGTKHWRFLDRDAVDLNFPERVATQLGNEPFDILINAAAYTAVDAAEDDAETARRVNALSVAEMAKYCHARGALFIHISTDYVFGGNNPAPAAESDAVAPRGVYGTTKWEGEEAVRLHCPHHIILRTSWLYGAHGQNFLNTMLRLSTQRPELQVVYDQVGTPTFVNDLADAIRAVTAKYEVHSATFPFGTYHFANEGVASWYDFAHAIFQLSGREVALTPVRSAQFPTRASRPPYSVLSKQKIRDTFGIDIRHWRDALAHCLESMPEL